MKKFFATLFVFLLTFFSVLTGCATESTPPDTTPPDDDSPVTATTQSRVRAYDVPEGVNRYEGATVKIGDTEIPMYEVMINTSQTWVGENYSRVANGVCLFELDGIAEVTVTPNVQINYSSVMRPLSAKITPVANIGANTLTFKIKSAGEYVLEINGDVHNAIHFFVSDYDESAGPEAYTGYDNVIVFEPGLHTAENDDRISGQYNRIDIDSNTLVYLSDGAVVRASFYENNLDNIAIVGRGILDGSAFERTTTHGDIVTIPIEFNYCTNILLKDFFILDPAGWAITNYFADGSKIENVKVISSRSNGDGISIQSCKNVEVDGCFIRSWDDSLVVKNYPRWNDRTQFGDTDNIKFTNCTVWTDLAQSMEIGYETTTKDDFKNVSFENITVLHAMHNAVISIHNANNAEIKDITFKNITIEDGTRAASNIGLIDIQVVYSSNWSTSQTAATPLGNIDGVSIENINVIASCPFRVNIGGWNDTRPGFESVHYVRNVSIKNVAVAWQKIAESSMNVIYSSSQNLVDNFTFTQEDGVEVTGASFIFTQTDEELAKFEAGCTVELI